MPFEDLSMSELPPSHGEANVSGKALAAGTFTAAGSFAAAGSLVLRTGG